MNEVESKFESDFSEVASSFSLKSFKNVCLITFKSLDSENIDKKWNIE